MSHVCEVVEESVASVVQCYRAGLLTNRSSDRSWARDMVHNKVHLIRPGCLGPNIDLAKQNRGLKHQSFTMYALLCRCPQIPPNMRL